MKTLKVENPAGLPTISWEDIKKKFETNSLKEKKNRDVGDLKLSILKHGFKIPLVIWEQGNYITDGAGRVLALEMLEYEGYTIPDIPYVPILAKSKKNAKELTLAISSQYGNITEESFKEFVLDLQEIDLGIYNLPGLNFEGIEWKPQGKTEYEVQEDEAPEVPKVAKSKVGDMYQLGKHRLLCGDALSTQDVATLMGGKKADLIVTDPPYNVSYVGKTKDALTIQNDKQTDDKFREFLRSAFLAMNNHLKPGGSFYVWHADSEGYNFRGACQDVGWQIRQCVIWVKNSLVLGRQDYHWRHEPCLYGWKEGSAHVWNSDRKQTTVLEFDRPTRSKEHPTMKPVKMIAYQVQNNSIENQIVLDTFGGGGSTLVACEQTNRVCYMMELDPKYVDVIIERWENLTGKKAKKL